MNHAKKKRGVPDAMSETPLRPVCGILCGQRKSAEPHSFKKLQKQKKTPEIREFLVLSCRVLTEKMRSGKFQASVASYIEFYNTKRPHCTLKNLTPCQAEENFNKNAK